MVPAQQCFCAYNPLTSKINLGLEAEAELVSMDGLAHVFNKGKARNLVVIDGVVVELEVPFPTLRRIHGHVRATHYFKSVLIRIGHENDADAATDHQSVFTHLHFLIQQGDDLIQQGDDAMAHSLGLSPLGA